jgi:GTP-binding protein
MVFVDFPGYGFARVPLEMQRSWGPMIETYLKNRQQLSGVIQFVDSRRPPTESDRVLMNFFVSFNIPFAIAATKSDKLNSREKITYIRNIGSELGTEIPVIMFSSMTGFGKNELWKQIRTFIE